MLGDTALLFRFGSTIDARLNDEVHRWAAHLRAGRPAWLRDLVPAYATLGVYIDVEDPELGDAPLTAARRWTLRQLDDPPPSSGPTSPRTVDIPVCYGGEYGPDLDAAAAELGLTPDEVTQRHAAGAYRVAMIGFAPGFPYLLGLDPSIALPRHATPRVRVEAGSVGIGGAQTGIYPRPSPGGWRIIGRTPVSLFDPRQDPPALLGPGDRIRFVAAGPEIFTMAVATR